MRLLLLLVIFIFCTAQGLSENSEYDSEENETSSEDYVTFDVQHGDKNETYEVENGPHAAEHGSNQSHAEHHGIALANWRWNEYGDYFVMCLMITLAAVAKVAFHESRYLSKHFPESCVLIIIGIIVGVIVYYGVDREGHHFPE